MASPSEITGLQLSLVSTLEQIDCALDTGNRRAFVVWCKRRTSLITRIERTLLAMATAKVPA